MTEAILVTGGAGYIGSHACVALLNAGFSVVVLDNFCNSHPVALERVEKITGRALVTYRGDMRDRALLNQIFIQHTISAVMHFAGLKAVGESCSEPLRYYENNISGTLVLLQAMQAHAVHRLIFSSSATVYSANSTMPLDETAALGACNPYGQTKQMTEQILCDVCAAAAWQVALLRYFNPVGAHASGLIGEDPAGIPNNLLPYIAQVAAGVRAELPVFGDDYATPDGTGVRDYIHVEDLVAGHLAALRLLLSKPEAQSFCRAYNLGTGQGYSVLEMVKTFERISGKPVPYRVMPRRDGDVAECWADASRAREELQWVAEKSLETMLADSWRWQLNNPQGYRG
ncbi:MAG: UDP-glucose 4-epimerase GalE [Pseudomonadales bacterium]